MTRANTRVQMDKGIIDDQGMSSKRGFSLVNEKENSENCDPIKNKVKRITVAMVLYDTVMEEARKK